METPIVNKLPQYLKELRKSHGYQQEFVASHLNITRQTYSHYETGRITPPVNSLYNLAALYGIPVENFLSPTTSTPTLQKSRSLRFYRNRPLI